MDLTQAQEQRDEAIDQVATSAGESWIDAAYEALRQYAERGTRFMVEDVRLAYPKLPKPHDNRAWGAVTSRAVRNGLIERVGYAPSRTGHCRPMPVWRAVV